MAPILLIKYAVSGCNAEQVTTIFNHVFCGAVVERVVTLDKINYTTGAPFHMFFIHLTETPTPSLMNFMSQFNANPVQRIVYRDPWYWNVVVAESRSRVDATIQHAINQIPSWMPAPLEQ